MGAGVKVQPGAQSQLSEFPARSKTRFLGRTGYRCSVQEPQASRRRRWHSGKLGSVLIPGHAPAPSVSPQGPLPAVRRLPELAAGSEATLGRQWPPWLLPPVPGVGAPKAGSGHPPFLGLEFGWTRSQSVQPNSRTSYHSGRRSSLRTKAFRCLWDPPLPRPSILWDSNGAVHRRPRPSRSRVPGWPISTPFPSHPDWRALDPK